MRKPKVHKLHQLRNWRNALTTLYFAKCGRDVAIHDNWVKTWRGVPVADRCKNCLRAEKGKR